jgi:hypothetical protein
VWPDEPADEGDEMTTTTITTAAQQIEQAKTPNQAWDIFFRLPYMHPEIDAAAAACRDHWDMTLCHDCGAAIRPDLAPVWVDGRPFDSDCAHERQSESRAIPHYESAAYGN